MTDKGAGKHAPGCTALVSSAVTEVGFPLPPAASGSHTGTNCARIRSYADVI
jgi:hypothetical protein